MSGEQQQQPLLLSSSADYQPRVPVWTGDFPLPVSDAFVSGSEIRAAASRDPYPSWINAGVVTPQPQSENTSSTRMSHDHSHVSGQPLQEDEIRELLVDHVSHHCCWGKQPAWSWNIQKVEDCNSYVGTLEVFIEERHVIDDREPYDGGEIDNKGRTPSCWELDTRDVFPPLFVSSQEAHLQLPHSETVVKCTDCSGKGEVLCKVCTSRDSAGNIHQRKHFTCSRCQGRGLIAHMDGSDSSCKECKGTGKVYCSNCRSRGLLKCDECRSQGAFLVRKSVLVKWSTIRHRKVVASCHAASVPDEVFERAKGVKLWSKEAHQCRPAKLGDSVLDRFSEEVIGEKPAIPARARIVTERHEISLVPVTRVVMAKGSKLFMFYVVGLKKEIFMKEYPGKCRCGSCCSQGCSIL